MIELYLAGTANGLRAAVALEECGLQYRPHAVDLAKNEQRNPEFLKINPAGLIPALVDPEGPGGKPLTLSQSGAIVLYAAEKSGRFLPRDAAQRAIALQWFMQAASDISGAATRSSRSRIEHRRKAPPTSSLRKSACSTTSQSATGASKPTNIWAATCP
jgi:GST-like protein